ncbi:MAG TPA: Hsp20/alpha crystallin family protein [Xanthobacteraceae bacterium]|nr:Hsp20/alpha crystallin family protein [Xanthobacteraceae bacterium]
MRQEVDRLFSDFGQSFWQAPFRRSMFALDPFRRANVPWSSAPAVDVTENEKEYEITAELPGMDEKDIEVTVTNHSLVIRGEKQEDKEERKKDYYLHERHFGSFERRFELPEEIDGDKIEATFKNGVLEVKLPKTADARKAEKKITVKAQ